MRDRKLTDVDYAPLALLENSLHSTTYYVYLPSRDETCFKKHIDDNIHTHKHVVRKVETRRRIIISPSLFCLFFYLEIMNVWACHSNIVQHHNKRSSKSPN